MPTATVTGSQFTDFGRPAGVSQCYKVEGHNAAGVGALSAEVCAIPAGGPAPILAPTGPGANVIIPTLNLSGIPRKIRVSSRGVFTLSFAGTPSTRGSLSLRTVKRLALPSAKRVRTLARKSFSSSPTGHVRMRIKLARKYLRALKRARLLGVRATVTLGALTRTRRSTLQAPK